MAASITLTDGQRRTFSFSAMRSETDIDTSARQFNTKGSECRCLRCVSSHKASSSNAAMRAQRLALCRRHAAPHCAHNMSLSCPRYLPRKKPADTQACSQSTYPGDENKLTPASYCLLPQEPCWQ
eukprot:6094507-Amphidinium_carterae.1